MTSFATAQDIVDALIQLREDRAALDAQEQFLKEQLTGAMALGELEEHEQAEGVYQFANAKYSRVERNSYKHSPQALKAIAAIKEQDIDAGLAERNVTIFWRLDSAF